MDDKCCTFCIHLDMVSNEWYCGVCKKNVVPQNDVCKDFSPIKLANTEGT